MDTAAIRCLINSISRFIHLVSCQALKPLPTQKDFKNMIGSLKLMKQVLDEVVKCKIYSHGFLIEECEELDLAVNEAREFMESWCSKMSKIFSVLRSEPLLIRIQSSSLTVCHRLSSLSAPSTSTKTGVTDYVVCCMQELQCLKLDRLSEQIEEALRSQRTGQVPSAQLLKEIVYSLSLNSNQEILKETMAVEKERMKAQTKLTEGELDQVNQVVKLVSNMRDFLIKLDPFRAINGIPIPPDFRCPLSLELMLDPVIVASGQTYDRPYIQKWLDNGLNICPKTRQLLVHTHLIPNYTVKALIKHWCEGNKIRFFEVCNDISAIPSDRASPQNLIHTDSFGRSLPSSDSASLSSLEVGNGFEQLRLDASSGSSEEGSNACPNKETEKFDHPSPKQSYAHSRRESASSAGSSIEYLPPASNEILRISNDHVNSSELSREITSEYHASLPTCKVPGSSPWLAGKQFHSSEARTDVTSNGSLNYPGMLSLPLSDSGTDNLTSISHVEKLVEDLKSQSNEVQTTAAAELRLLAKHKKENRNIISRSGAIPPLVSLLYSEVKLTQEHVVTALLNLSINENNKAMIAEAGAIEPLIYVLKSGNPGAKENAAATLFSLSVVEEYKAKIGRSGAVKALADLLSSGTLRGQKDAATALFNLSIFHENKAHIVKSGAVKYLVELMDPASEMADKALALLTNLSTIAEGRSAIVREGGIPLLVEAVETGSQRGKENAASTLLQLCLDSSKFCTLVLQEGAVPPLVALSQSGTPRAKEKAQQLLSHFRSQREGATKKGKP